MVKRFSGSVKKFWLREDSHSHVQFSGMKLFTLCEHLKDCLHALLARLGLFSGLKAPGDCICIRFGQILEKYFRFFVFRELLEKILWELHVARRVVSCIPAAVGFGSFHLMQAGRFHLARFGEARNVVDILL